LSKPTVPDKLRGKKLEDLLSTTGSNSFASDSNGSKTSTHQRRRRQKEWQYSRLAQEEETAPVASPVDDTLEGETAPVASPVDNTSEEETAAEVAEEIDFQNAQTSTPIFFAVRGLRTIPVSQLLVGLSLGRVREICVNIGCIHSTYTAC
jgi:hypothetical protein